ncbi:MAG: zinc ribbon domain-containing protein [Xanthomonadaceae bacterium]|nr:zinc ribbon domain-containing protein [Xanthomonadaceae bacterium]MDP2186861.1 zinc ribbon domain-containing protein [Xanthomonadales bacterium]MDZ4114934.1 zinc ribbon domain-containing protein [Xanthomonadaceae bacterium]MDZ4377448.1 zinc ribbon domain-containing protein [Xanthomonadaceae bacterium]
MTVIGQVNAVSLLGALDATRNWRAYVALLLGGLVATLAGALTGYFVFRFQMWNMGAISALIGGIGFIVSVLIFVVAFSAAGTSLLDQAKGIPQRPLISLFFSGVGSLGRLLLLGLALLLIYTAILIGVIVLLFLAKIPGIGPLFYGLVFPLAALVFGLFGFVVVFVVNPLAAPAVWDGNGVMQTLAKLLTLARRDMLKIVVSQSLLFLLLLFVGAILFGTIFGGISSASAVSAMIIDLPRGMGIASSMYALQSLALSGNGYIGAWSIGVALLLGSVALALLLIAISGNCIIYLQYAANVDASGMEETLRLRAQQLKAKAEAVQAQAKQQAAAAQQAWQERQREAARPPLTGAAPMKACPQCQSPVTKDDVFCGHCGHRQSGNGG